MLLHEIGVVTMLKVLIEPMYRIELRQNLPSEVDMTMENIVPLHQRELYPRLRIDELSQREAKQFVRFSHRLPSIRACAHN